MGTILGMCLKALGFFFKMFFFLGFGWWLLPIGTWWLLEEITGQYADQVTWMYWTVEILCWVAAIMTPLQAIQNIVRAVKKDRTFSIFAFIKNLFVRTKKVGFTSEVDGEIVDSVKSNSVNGFVFGKSGSTYITKPEDTDGHMLIIGGAGSGKTSGIAIPTLMSWKNRVFAIDIKGELYEKTKDKRDTHNIKVFNPTDRYSFGYDPFYVLDNSTDISLDARNLAIALISLSPDVKDPFWIKSAQTLLTGLIIYYFSIGFDFSSTMKTIKSSSVKNQIEMIMKSDMDKAKLEISQFVDMDEKTLSGIFSEVSNHITVFATNDDLQRALSRSSSAITPKDLENGYDIYCCIPEEKLDPWKDLFAMMINQFLKEFEKRSESNTTPILFLIDEFARLGKIESIANGLATLRSKKIHIALFVQSKAQLNVNYGKDMAEVITDNCSYKAILRASEPTTQEWCSKLVGTYDKEKKSNSYNADMIGIGKGTGTSKTTEEKKIIKPEEFAYLEDIVCIFPNGYKRIDKIKYWEDKAFK